jgi:aryl-alcohol dehydrogenase-like predicted oxidoreductase
MHKLKGPLPTALLGASNIQVGLQGLGCMGMSEFYGSTDPAEAEATIRRALELGVTMLDTADMYGFGANEKFLSPFVQAHRSRVVIATKFGFTRTATNPNDWSVSNRPEYIRAAAEASLQRLGVEVIDLYYMHRRTNEVPLAESVGAMADLVSAGKVRALGLSEVTEKELREAHAIHPIAALQTEWSVFSRDLEQDIVPLAVQLGVSIVPYAPLGRGMLVGKAFFETALQADDMRQYSARFSAENRESNQRLVACLESLSIERGVSTAQLALAWVYTRAQQMGVVAVPIPGTRKLGRLEENVAAATLRLTLDEMLALEPLAQAVRGARSV